MPRIFVATREGLRIIDGRGTPKPFNTTAARSRRSCATGPSCGRSWTVPRSGTRPTPIGAASPRSRWLRRRASPSPTLCSSARRRRDCSAWPATARRGRLVRRGGGSRRWHTPWGGPPDTRSISEWGEAVYVNVHVGGILRTLDGGASWTPTIAIDADVHQVASAEGMVLAACAEGLAVSADRGGTWTMRTDGLDARYSRAVTSAASPSSCPRRTALAADRAAVYRGDLAGGSFERCRDGLPEWFDDNIDTHCLDAPPAGPSWRSGRPTAGCSPPTDAGWTWTELASGLPSIRHILVVPARLTSTPRPRADRGTAPAPP